MSSILLPLYANADDGLKQILLPVHILVANRPEFFFNLLISKLAFNFFTIFEELVGHTFHFRIACQPDERVRAFGDRPPEYWVRRFTSSGSTLR